MNVVDISVSGLRVQSPYKDVPLEHRSSVEVTLQRQFSLPPLQFAGEVVHLSPLGNRPIFGVKITQIDQEAQNLWNQLVSCIRERNHQDKTQSTGMP